MAKAISPKDQKENNPCLKEQLMSMNCLSDNNYNYGKCFNHFENFKHCRSFWSKVRRHRRQTGVTPSLPPPEEREQIKKKYFETGSFI